MKIYIGRPYCKNRKIFCSLTVKRGKLSMDCSSLPCSPLRLGRELLNSLEEREQAAALDGLSLQESVRRGCFVQWHYNHVQTADGRCILVAVGSHLDI